MFFLIATVVLCSFKHSCVLVHIYFNDIQVDICVYHIYIYMYICKYTNFCKILLTVKIDSNLIFKVITLKNQSTHKFTHVRQYSQTCSNDHLYKTTTRLRRPILGPPEQIPIQSLLYKTTTCLTRPATTFFVSQMKKNLSKTTTTKLYPAKKQETNIGQQGIKINLSLIIFTLLLLYNAKFVQCL